MKPPRRIDPMDPKSKARNPIAGLRFHVLYVCEANQCRSPMAQFLLKDALVRRWGPVLSQTWIVESAGVRVRRTAPLDASAEVVLNELDVAVDEFRSRPLSRSMVSSADLILTAQREHRAAVVKLDPSALQRAFTIRQFARLTDLADTLPPSTPAQFGLAIRQEALRMRAHLQPTDADHENLPDPVGRPLKAFRQCAAVLNSSIDLMLQLSPQR